MTYEEKISNELAAWKRQMLRRPGYFNKLSKTVQDKINRWIPEKIHKGITVTIKQMVRGVLFSAHLTTKKKYGFQDLIARDIAADEKIKFYQGTAVTEGAITGAGGILLGLADFPLLLAIKIKLLFELASIYGYNTEDYKERVYILHIFQLAFSSAKHRKHVFTGMLDWDEKSEHLPESIHQFDWRTFQQEYRDYIDLAKMAQLIPVIGAPVGAVANYALVKKLGKTAKNAYRMRHDIFNPKNKSLMSKNKRNAPEKGARNQENIRNENDINDSPGDSQKLKQDKASLDLPDVRDIPGQEHIHVPPLGELADTTISSADEEGIRVFEDDIDDETRIVMGSEDDIPKEDKIALQRMDNLDVSQEDDAKLVRGMPDNRDDDGDLLNEKVNVSGSDLDTAIVDEDDADENIGEEDEENNTYSLGSDSEQDDGGSRG